MNVYSNNSIGTPILLLLLLALSIILTFIAIRYSKRSHYQSSWESYIGHSAEVLEIINGQQCWVRIQGEIWKAKVVDGTRAKAGEFLQVISHDGLTLLLKAGTQKGDNSWTSSTLSSL